MSNSNDLGKSALFLDNILKSQLSRYNWQVFWVWTKFNNFFPKKTYFLLERSKFAQQCDMSDR